MVGCSWFRFQPQGRTAQDLQKQATCALNACFGAPQGPQNPRKQGSEAAHRCSSMRPQPSLTQGHRFPFVCTAQLFARVPSLQFDSWPDQELFAISGRKTSDVESCCLVLGFGNTLDCCLGGSSLHVVVEPMQHNACMPVALARLREAPKQTLES